MSNPSFPFLISPNRLSPAANEALDRLEAAWMFSSMEGRERLIAGCRNCEDVTSVDVAAEVAKALGLFNAPKSKRN
jgi:hypothetical protein